MPSKTLDTDEMSSSSDDFEALYESNAPLIYRFMFWRTKNRMLAEDLTSNVFEKAWRSRDSFKGGSAKAWLHKIARNTLVDHWRKSQEIVTNDSAVLDPETSESALGEQLDKEMLISKLELAVTKLPEEMSSVVRMRFIEGLSARQTGKKLGLSEANVRVIQYRALCKLRSYMS